LFYAFVAMGFAGGLYAGIYDLVKNRRSTSDPVAKIQKGEKSDATAQKLYD